MHQNPAYTGFQIQTGELAGFDICGVKLDDGTYRLMGPSRRIINEFPAEIAFMGNTYTLEAVEVGAPYEDGTWVNALYA